MTTFVLAEPAQQKRKEEEKEKMNVKLHQEIDPGVANINALPMCTVQPKPRPYMSIKPEVASPYPTFFETWECETQTVNC